jgi:glycosyltransferase involved in cell wall biosynthesis
MRIAFLCGFAWEPKGTVRARAFPLAVELSKLGHEVHLFVTPYDNPRDSGKELTLKGVKITNLEVSSNSPLSMALLAFRLATKSLAWKPDIIHVFKPKGITGLAARMLLWRKVPFVLDCDDWEGWGGWNDVKNYSWAIKTFIDWQERSLIRSAPALTVASRVLEGRAMQIGRWQQDIFYAPNGVADETFGTADIPAGKSPSEAKQMLGLADAPVILYVGHFDPLDDAMFFARCTAPVATRFGATIAIVGEGPELSRVEKFFHESTQARVHFFGQLSHEQYTKVVAIADVAVFPYPDNPVYRAKCSVRIIDFMAAAKPVLSSAVGQNPEYIISNESGILVNAGDRGGYERALGQLLSNAPLREKLGTGGRKRLRELFLWSGQSTHALIEAYRRVSGNQANHAPRRMAVESSQS